MIYTKMLDSDSHRLVGAGFRQLANRWGLKSLAEQKAHDKEWAMGKLYLHKCEGGLVGVGANFHNAKNICKGIAEYKKFLRSTKRQYMCNTCHYAGQHKSFKIWGAKRDTKKLRKIKFERVTVKKYASGHPTCVFM